MYVSWDSLSQDPSGHCKQDLCILEAILTAIIAAAVATYGHESIRNFGRAGE